MDSSILRAAFLVFNQFELAAECVIALLRDESQFVAYRSQAAVGVILSEQESVFRARGHHSVRIGAALCDEVVYERSDIRAGTVEFERVLFLNLACGVDARYQSLRGSLFVSARTVELACAEESVKVIELKTALERERIDAVIFYSICGAHDLTVLQSGDSVQEFELHILRQRR